MKGEPPGVGSAEEGASDFVPVGLGVRKAGNGQVLGRSTYWPSSLGDPNGLASNSSLGYSQCGIEQTLTIVDTVGHGVLEVRVCVHSDEVTGVDDRVDATFGPASPSIDVTNGNILQARALDGVTKLADI